jgi:hypothetical protein
MICFWWLMSSKRTHLAVTSCQGQVCDPALRQ